MAQFEYQVVEQGGAKVGHFNERIAEMVSKGYDCIGITGTSPHVSILLRRPAQPAQAQAAAAQAGQPAPRPAPAAPAAPAPRPQPQPVGARE